jgi:hypothetical protein
MNPRRGGDHGVHDEHVGSRRRNLPRQGTSSSVRAISLSNNSLSVGLRVDLTRFDWSAATDTLLPPRTTSFLPDVPLDRFVTSTPPRVGTLQYPLSRLANHRAAL